MFFYMFIAFKIRCFPADLPLNWGTFWCLLFGNSSGSDVHIMKTWHHSTKKTSSIGPSSLENRMIDSTTTSTSTTIVPRMINTNNSLIKSCKLILLWPINAYSPGLKLIFRRERASRDSLSERINLKQRWGKESRLINLANCLGQTNSMLFSFHRTAKHVTWWHSKGKLTEYSKTPRECSGQHKFNIRISWVLR